MSAIISLTWFFILITILPTIQPQETGIQDKESCCSKRVGTYNTALSSLQFASLNGCFCREIQDGYTLCYNANNLPNCKNYPKQIKINTTELILRSTSIKEILVDDFSNLRDLVKLTIENNPKLDRIQELAFKYLTKLTTLNIISNPSLNHLHPDAFQGLVSLKELKIVYCGFSMIGELTKALQIKVVPNLQNLNVTGNNFVSISADDFVPMGDTKDEKSQLQELDMSSCGIHNMEIGALNHLKKLTKLHIGGNSLATNTLVDLLESSISTGINLTSLDVQYFGINGSVPESLTKLIATSNINSLTLSGNNFGVLDGKTLPNSLPNLKTLDMSNVFTNFIEDSFYEKIPNVEKLILNKHNLSYFTIPKRLPNLKYLDLSEFTKKGAWEFFHLETQLPASSLEYLDLHSTRMAFLLRDSFKFLPSLKELNLKNCILAKFSTGSFNGLSNLKYLNLEDNKFFIMYMKYPSEPFLGLENLETLLLGGNAISYISSNGNNLFKHLKSVKCLGLQKNSLEVITAFDFEPLESLEILDISWNPLYAWDDRVFFKSKLEKFYASSNYFTYLSRAMLADFGKFSTLDIGYSPFSCDCRMMRRMYPDKILLKEIKNSERYKNLLCAGSHEVTMIDFLETSAYSDCEPKKSFMMYFLGTFFVIVFLLAVFILMYMVKDQIPYASAFIRSTQGRQNIL
ncbi:leucine-rich repeat-containing protein 15-like [Harmonia axyridis]|uniref:leucine-rich repeat-containing protein 15-like n=1 Tax=Harmonia axyridis TaxID=115357 RepID=UPI001E279AA0|nr:leucine-rich repeat-containing protein 15-like [Harmonia axyridis]